LDVGECGAFCTSSALSGALASTLHGVSGLDPARDDLGNDTRLKLDVWRL